MADEKVEFPYKAEYAKSGRASCKACKTKIDQSVLRLAVMVQSPNFDGKIPHWYHHMCFFSKQKPKSTDDIGDFDSLKWDDQEKIKAKIAESGPVAVKGKKPSKKAKKDALKGDFTVEYAKSSRAMCRGCEVKIAKDEVRISKKDYESEDARRYGGKDLWHHVECFAKLRNELEFFESGDILPGYQSLKKEDQATVKKSLPEIERPKVKDEVDGEPPAKKAKKEEKSSKEDEEMKKQNKLIFKYKDMLKQLSKDEVATLLEYNNLEDQSGPDSRIDLLADCMAFGTLLSCSECKGGQFIYKSGVGYQCRGDISQWTKCLKIETNPLRKAFKVPKSISEDNSSFKKYKCVIGERKFVARTVPSTSVKSEDTTDSGPKVERKVPLKNLNFLILGKLKNKEDIKRKIIKLGGTVATSCSKEITAVISNTAEVEKCNSKMEEVKDAEIHVVPEGFIDECASIVGSDTTKDVEDLITKLSIAPWGSNLQTRMLCGKLNSAAKSKSGYKSLYTKSVPSKVTLKVKNGLAVDPDSELADRTSVYVDKKHGPYSVTLSKSMIETGENSYYKIQLLQPDNSSCLNRNYYVFRSWGRIGTTIGNSKTSKFITLKEAQNDFERHYEEKTGNSFKEKEYFVKKPDCYYPVDVDYGASDNVQMSLESSVPSKLKESVQQLVSMLFDVDTMKKVMMEFELDLEKMPLGKLSRKQILLAFKVLNELQQRDGDAKPAIVKDASNRFYTLIPHSFGVDNPPLLDNKEIIESKVEMLESLLEMETAYNLLREVDGQEADDDTHPIDKHYTKLNTHIDVVEQGSEDYVLIDDYVKNTHGETHRTYELEILDLFKIRRLGEEKRFKPFKQLHNRKLLWHGSRLTNFAGILSQGLRIAPPEAPVTGYMFGKGIYFADMVSKSANYCMTSKGNDIGLLLLCEVALGEMYERTHAEYVEKLPKGKHSTKGIGMTHPNPEQSVNLSEGLEVPVGKGVKSSTKSSLLYNEYIVYDPAQVKARYLVKAKFNYKYY